MELHSEVRPIVQTMPGSEAFVLQTGGSARRRTIRPEGAAPTITFRVSGVPGHTHNSSAVASVLCDLKRHRQFTHNLTDAWADEVIELRSNDIGDSQVVLDEDERFDRAIERGVGEITLIPENCHQQIREPTRSIAEVRALVTPADKLETMTYVEEVGGFVDPRDEKIRHISDYPDILVDILGQQDVNLAEKDGDVWTGVGPKTAVLVQNVTATREPNGTGTGFSFVVLRDGTDAVGVRTDDGTPWHGIVSFRWIQTEMLYRSAPFTVRFPRTIEVGPRPGAGQPYANEDEGPLTVTFPAMETTVASNGYCFLIDSNINATTVLLGATQDNGLDFQPRPYLNNVTKPGLQSVSNFRWNALPAYRFVVGGDAALPGPHVKETQPFFEILRNMRAFKLTKDMGRQFKILLDSGDNDHWVDDPGTDDLVDPKNKFGAFFENFRFEGREDKAMFPVAGLPRNAHPGATWYPLKDPWRSVKTCQQVLAYNGGGVAATGQEVIRGILAALAAADAANWNASDIVVQMNEADMMRHFDPDHITPPGIATTRFEIEQWRENVMPNVSEHAQAQAEAAQEAAVGTAQQNVDTGVTTVEQHTNAVNVAQQAYNVAVGNDAANQDQLLIQLGIAQNTLAASVQALTGLRAVLAAAQAEMVRIVDLRVPHFDNWYVVPHSYTGKVRFSITSAAAAAAGESALLLEGFTDPEAITKKMMMIRQRMVYYRQDEVQDFVFDQGDVFHDQQQLNTSFYHLLCDTNDTYGTEPVIRAGGSIKELFELKTYVDVDDNSVVKELHVNRIGLPQDWRPTHIQLTALMANGETDQVSAENLQAYLAELAISEGAQHDPVTSGYVDNGGNLQHLPIVTAYRNLIATRNFPEYLTMGVGNALEVLMPNPLGPALPALRPQLIAAADAAAGVAELVFQDLAFGFESPRMFFLSLNNIGQKAAHIEPECFYFSTADCVTEARQVTLAGGQRMHVCTRVKKVYRGNAADSVLSAAQFAASLGHAHGNMRNSCCLCQLGPEFQDLWFGEDGKTNVFKDIQAESRRLGPVFLSKRRISQHLCAPILNPNARLQCSAPLNYETRHLPPELRDFVLRLGNVDWGFLPGKVSMEPLTLYEFNGGNQMPAAQENLLHLPQFRQGSTTELTEKGEFDFEVFSPYGMPSYIAVFARDTNFKIDSGTQPLVTRLSIMCSTTQKKSNTILDADVHQLYHITQRNVHPRANFNRFEFNERQVVLLRAEDIGLLGLRASEFQYEKRAVFRLQGTVNQVGRVTALLIFNNRGLRVQGKQLSVERLVRRVLR